MKHTRRFVSMLLALALLAALIPSALAAGTYQDVPAGSWAAEYIEKAKTYGLMNGQGNGRFGYGATVTNAELAQLLCNMMGWTLVEPETASYYDVTPDKWYYGAVETALSHGVYDMVLSRTFHPEQAVTREEMAAAFVRALGLEAAAEIEEHLPAAFTDLVRQGYANVAASIGLMNGTGGGKFSPYATAKREEVAAMLVRFYETWDRETDFVHGFYAYSSYSQRDLAKRMDAVTYQWSSMTASGALDTTGELKIPDSYESILTYLGGVKQHLGVYMSAGVDALLSDETLRAKAVGSILAELDRTYEKTGTKPYSGVTVDFEGLRGEAVKADFNAFLTELKQGLDERGMTLYVTVQPALYDSTYFDGFDFRTIGELADKVILMAHDYAPSSMDGLVGSDWHTRSALTPIGKVYYALKMATDSETGVQDPSKLVLALSMDAQGWYIDENDKVTRAERASIGVARMAEVLAGDVLETGYSDFYQNAYAVYETDEGERVYAWYEDARSIGEKISLAKCFGVTGVSVWRLGNIPNTAAYDVTGAIFPAG